MQRRAAWLAGLTLAAGAVAIAGFAGSYIVPIDSEPIRYSKGPVSDPVFQLQQRLDSGSMKLK